MINKALLCATLAKVREEAKKPEGECLWRQQAWQGYSACGTTYCFAGWATVLAKQSMPIRVMDVGSESHFIIDGELMHVSCAAHTLLGLQRWQSDRLFCPINGIGDIERIVEEIFDSEEAEV